MSASEPRPGASDGKHDVASKRLIAGVGSAAAFTIAVGAIGALELIGVSNAVTLAAISTLVVAGVLSVLRRSAPFETSYTPWRNWLRHGADFGAAALGLWGVMQLFSESQEFLCEPLVPWRVSIAIFGAFGMTWLARSISLRAPTRRMPLMILLAFFWIAPFYGFFHAPWFLAQVIVAPCPQRPLGESLAAVAAMVFATELGRRTADWLFEPRS